MVTEIRPGSPTLQSASGDAVRQVPQQAWITATLMWHLMILVGLYCSLYVPVKEADALWLAIGATLVLCAVTAVWALHPSRLSWWVAAAGACVQAVAAAVGYGGGGGVFLAVVLALGGGALAFAARR